MKLNLTDNQKHQLSNNDKLFIRMVKIKNI